MELEKNLYGYTNICHTCKIPHILDPSRASKVRDKSDGQAKKRSSETLYIIFV